MLTIHSGINQNFRPAFGQRRPDREDSGYMSETERLKQQYEDDEDRALWENQKQNFDEMIARNEAKVPKPIKTTMRVGSIFAAGVLGGMATGWSAKYIMAAFRDMYKSNVVQKFTGKFKDNISTPVKKGFCKLKTFVSTKWAAIKETKTYQNNKTKLNKKIANLKDSSFAKSLNKLGKKVSENKYVQKVTGGIDAVFSFIADGIVKAYNKIAGINYKKAAVGTLSVAGGISSGAVEAMDGVKKTSEGEE